MSPAPSSIISRKANLIGWTILIVVILAIALVSSRKSGTGDPPKRGAQGFDEAAYIQRGQQAVKSRLKDPESATYKNSYVSRSAGGPAVCGEVNAKNGFGGYNGFQPFIAVGDVAVIASDEDWAVAWKKFCAF